MTREKAGIIAAAGLFFVALLILLLAVYISPPGDSATDEYGKEVSYSDGENGGDGLAGREDGSGSGNASRDGSGDGDSSGDGTSTGGESSDDSGTGPNSDRDGGSGEDDIPESGEGETGVDADSANGTGISEAGVAVTGRVLTAEGFPVAGATLGAYSFRDLALLPPVEADEYGYYEIVTGEPDNLSVTVSAEGYAPVRKTEVLSPGIANFTLGAGSRLEGRVFEEESGFPVEKFSVNLAHADVDFLGFVAGGFQISKLVRTIMTPPEAKTSFSQFFEDPTGQFVFENVPPGSYNMAVCAESTHLAVYAGMVEISADREVTTVEVGLPVSAPLAGRVVDSDSGAPVSGAVLTVTASGGRMMDVNPVEIEELTAITGGDGQFVFSQMPEKVGGTIHVEHPDYVSNAFSIGELVAAAPEAPAGATREVEIRIEQGGGVRGKIANADGTPAAGISLAMAQARNPNRGKTTITGSSGEYEFEGLASGNYFLMKMKDFASDAMTMASVTVKAGEVVELNMGIEGAVIYGIVTQGGSPKGGVNVTLRGGSRGFTIAVSHRDGSYELLNLVPGRYELSFGDMTKMFNPREGDTIHIEITGEEKIRKDLVVAGASIKGRIVNAASGESVELASPTGGPSAMQDYIVLLYEYGDDGELSEGPAKFMVIDRKGNFLIEEVDDGDYVLRVRLAGYQVEPQEVRVRGMNINIKVPAYKNSCVLKCVLIDIETEEPVSEVNVNIAEIVPEGDEDYAYAESEVSDQNGEFSFTTPEGVFKIRIFKPGLKIEGDETVETRRGRVSEYTIYVRNTGTKPRTATISGTVVDAEGRPASMGVSVVVVDLETNEYIFTQVGEDGTYRIDVPYGKLMVRCNRAGTSRDKTIDIGDGERKVVNFDFSPVEDDEEDEEPDEEGEDF